MSMSLESYRDEVSLRDLLAIFCRRFKGMAVIATIAMLVALIYIFGIRSDTFEATAKLLVRIGHEQANSVTALPDRTPVIGYREQDVASEVQIFNSSDIIAKVVDRLDLGRDEPPEVPEGLVARVRYEAKRVVSGFQEWMNEQLIRVGLRPRLSPREQVIDALSRGLSVASSKESNVVFASLRLPHREGVAPVLSAILDEYLSTRLSVFQQQEAVQLFRREMEDSLDELRAVEREASEFEAKSNIVSLDIQKKLLLEEIADLEREVAKGKMESAVLRGKVERLSTMNDSGQTDIGLLGHFREGTFAGQLMDELAKLERERVKLARESFTFDNHLENNRQQFNTALAHLFSNLTTILEETQSQLNDQTKALNAARDKLEFLHQHEAKWKDLGRQIKMREKEFEFHSRKYEEASVTSSMGGERIGNVTVIQQPITPLRPAGMRKLYLIVIAGVLAGLMALSWAAVTEFFDRRVYTAEQLARYLGARVVSVVPALSANELQDLRGAGN